jgi:hypothetical protein
MVQEDIHLRLLTTSMLDMNKVIEVLVCCLTGIWGHPYIVPPARLAQDFGLWVTTEVEMKQLNDG